ncbi:alginate lyase family protein [Rhizobium sp. MC63]|uniref:Alginate lyase family protein n=1 Tax=Rhizobium mulingense TaxID=3031128 RepID=A0ACC6N604_9HYPH|nr:MULTISPECIES: alginate lyase family protein [unclassified Rhizobium]MDF0700406.1 alginate lyase family protein [Rhizobium sp. MC63]MEA3521109.1 alginate lyase family protein [Rhizobium sp. MJ31]
MAIVALSRFSFLAAGAVLLLGGSQASQAASLTLPFQLARHVAQNNGNRDCSAKLPTPVISLNLTSIYEDDDESRSTVDPENKDRYDKAIAQTREFAAFVTKYASNYTETDGNRLDAASCTLQALDSWARAGALSDLKTRQSYLSATRIVAGAALAYAQVRPAATLLSYDTSAIEKWLGGLAERTIPVYTESGDRNSNKQNHRYWGGFAVTAVGVAIGRKDFLDFGFESYKLGVCQVTADGALPLELMRKKKARDYHLHAAGPLVMMASLLQANGYDALSQCDNGLRRLVHFALDSINDPSLMEKLAGEPQVKLPRDNNGLIRPDRIAWLDAYLHYYPEDRNIYKKFFDGALFSSNLGGRISVLYNVSQRD